MLKKLQLVLEKIKKLPKLVPRPTFLRRLKAAKGRLLQLKSLFQFLKKENQFKLKKKKKKKTAAAATTKAATTTTAAAFWMKMMMVSFKAFAHNNKKRF